jgi:nicotinamidase-related amidase
MSEGSPKEPGIRFGPIGESAVHLCVDMQRMFAEDTPWKTPWMMRILPQVVRLVELRPADSVFTRFIPLRDPNEAVGTWRRYYERWPAMTLQALEPTLLDLVDPLSTFAPPALVIDKRVFSPWFTGDLQAQLRRLGKDTVVVSGAETDVCVAATVLGAVDLGYRVIIATDAVCSSADATHDAMIDIYHDRFGMQIEAAETAEIIQAWS